MLYLQVPAWQIDSSVPLGMSAEAAALVAWNILRAGIQRTNSQATRVDWIAFSKHNLIHTYKCN